MDLVSGRNTSHPANPALDVSRGYTYDGAGRLRLPQRAGGGGVQAANLYYDVDDELVYEHRVGSAGVESKVRRFGGYRAEESGAGVQVVEEVLPMVRLEDGELRVVYLEPDGNAVWTRGRVAAIADSRELLGVYGLELLRYAHPVDPILDGYHGSEMDRAQEVVPFGVRHMALSDGAWLQPEPLLHLGMTNGDLGNPLAYLGRYAGGNPVLQADRGGEWVETAWDVANVAMGVASAVGNAAAGNYGAAAVDGVGVVVDVVAAVVPAVPGGAGTAIKAARAGDKVADLARSGNRVADVADTATDVAKAGGCFVAGTEVVTPAGTMPIEDIEEGRRVQRAGGCRVDLGRGRRGCLQI